MKTNLENFNKKMRDFLVANSPYERFTKVRMDNIIFPLWSKMNPAMMFRMSICTAEAPNGCDYDFLKYQAVVRIVNNRLLFDDPNRTNGKRYDSYAWPIEKVEKLVMEGLTKPIGTSSVEGLLNFNEVMNTLKTHEDCIEFAGLFSGTIEDKLIATTPAENRSCIIVTPEILKEFPYIVDEWQEADENGDAEVTPLCVGDAIVITFKDYKPVSVYRCEKEIFEATHIKGHHA